ncbi:MAG: hypothetical protein PHZ25_03465 [Candidatus Pacebacteria bacterium]|nr:hypothetical protein [Candidatus Paceibacterota bacterium]
MNEDKRNVEEKYNIDLFYKNLSEDDKKSLSRNDFKEMLEIMEDMPLEKLVEICDRPDIQLRFCSNDWRKKVPKEEIISALLADFPKSKIAKIVKEIEKI